MRLQISSLRVLLDVDFYLVPQAYKDPQCGGILVYTQGWGKGCTVLKTAVCQCFLEVKTEYDSYLLLIDFAVFVCYSFIL
ncbi:hypothetical protein [Candidatus Leptofilum sp.]|uniref:hypothetical protein n=1 Tax=Candidatus Leptofilum sp. TaxID=3241576 RepID=UPI003B5BE8AD